MANLKLPKKDWGIAEYELDAMEEPNYNVGQKVRWLCGGRFAPGTIVLVTRVTKNLYGGGGTKWFLELNNGGNSFPGRVEALADEDEP